MEPTESRAGRPFWGKEHLSWNPGGEKKICEIRVKWRLCSTEAADGEPQWWGQCARLGLPSYPSPVMRSYFFFWHWQPRHGDIKKPPQGHRVLSIGDCDLSSHLPIRMSNCTPTWGLVLLHACLSTTPKLHEGPYLGWFVHFQILWAQFEKPGRQAELLDRCWLEERSALGLPDDCQLFTALLGTEALPDKASPQRGHRSHP